MSRRTIAGKKFGGLRIDQAKRLKELENKNSRLKQILVDAELQKATLPDVAEENSEPGEATGGG